MARAVTYCRRCRAETVQSVVAQPQVLAPFTFAAPVVRMLIRVLFPPLCLSCLEQQQQELTQEFPFSSPASFDSHF